MTALRPWQYDAILALSAANLCFLSVWTDLLHLDRQDMFYFKSPPGAANFVATCLSVALLACLYFVAIKAMRHLLAKRHKVAAMVIFIPAAMIAVNPFVNVLSHTVSIPRGLIFPMLGRAGLFAGVIVAGIVVGGILIFFRRVLTIAALLLSLLVPLVLLFLGEGLRQVLIHNRNEFVDLSLAAKLPTPDSTLPRVVWIIFDELDYRLAFVDRRSDVAMPEFDRLRREALSGTQAHSPATDTIPSVPSLLSGKRYSAFRAEGPSSLFLAEAGSTQFTRWTAADTIFERVRRLNRNTGLTGCYIPYCRMISEVLTDCFWIDLGNRLNSLGEDTPNIALNQYRSLFEAAGYSLFGQTLTVRTRVNGLRELRLHYREMLADPDQGFVFVHLPAPHAPHPYDRFTKTFTKTNAPVQGYWDSLALADLLLGEMRSVITEAGLWDRTTVLVSSDHPHRWSDELDGKKDTRVPFLLKFPHQTKGSEYGKPVQTVCSRALLEAVMEGEVDSAEEAVQWLDRSEWR